MRENQMFPVLFSVKNKKNDQGMKRNPRVFNGKYISVTRQDDGTYRLNFKPLKVDEGFSVERYAFGVYRELHQALEGLVEK